MFQFVKLFIIAAAIATVYGQSSGTQDYYLLAQNELLHEIDLVQKDIDAVNARFADRLDVVELQQQQLLSEIQQVTRTLVPLQALSVSLKHCIQKHNSQLVTYDSAKSKMKVCSDKAEQTTKSLTSSPQSSVTSAKSQVITTLPKNVAKCDTKYVDNHTALEQCYVESVETATTGVKKYLDNAHEQLEKSLYDANMAIQTEVKCSFLVEKDSLETIGKTNAEINDCEESLDSNDNYPDDLAVIKMKTAEHFSLRQIAGQ